MRYAVIAKSEAIGGPSAVFTLHADTVVDAAFKVARSRGIPQTIERMQHLTVMPVSELPEGWDSGELGRGLRTTDLDADLYGAPGF